RLGDTAEGYVMVNFQQSTVDYTGFPPVVRGAANAGILYRPFSNDLRRTQTGYVYIANLLTAIAQGTFNFVDPSANTQQQIDFVS
uniref:hypothetical protein n=1 Tax=Allosphingosinicella vermicomposti TaxID=614671 RepID=UPI00131A58EE